MANWCLNTVSFRGTCGQTEQVKSLFEDMAAKIETGQEGQLHDFVSSGKGHFFEIYCSDDVFYYYTKWCLTRTC